MARIVDSKVKDDDWFKGHINGDLQSYNINSLINNVKSKRQSLHTNLTGKSGNVYTVFIDGSLESNLDEGSNMWIDIIVEKPDGQQKRLVSKKFNSWNECQKIFNDFKSRVRDSKMNDVDSKTHAFLRLRDSYVIEELPEDETADIYVPILKKYNLKIQKLSGNKVKVIGNRNDIIRYYDKEIGIDEDDIGIVDSKVEDNYIGVLPKERRYRYRGWVIIDRGYSSAPYSIEDYPYAKEFRTLEEAKAFIRKELSDSKKTEDSKVVDQSVKDAEWSNDWANLDDSGIDDRDKKAVEAYFKKLASKYGVSYVRTSYGMYPCPIFRGDKKRLEKLIYNEYAGRDRSSAEEEYELIEDSVKDNAVHDSKEMTMSDALKVLDIVDAYKNAKHR